MRLLRISFEGQFHFTASASRFVGGEDRFQDGTAVLAGNKRLFVVLDAIYEMRHFLREAVVPFFLVDGEGPTPGRAGLLDRIVVAYGAVSLDSVAVVEIGIGDALRTVDLGAVVHPAHLCPAFLSQRDD